MFSKNFKAQNKRRNDTCETYIREIFFRFSAQNTFKSIHIKHNPIEKLDFKNHVKNNMKKDVKNVIKNDVKITSKRTSKTL